MSSVKAETDIVALDPRERTTEHIFLGVEIFLCAIPLVFLASAGLFRINVGTQDGLRQLVAADPSIVIGFLSAFIQPIVAYFVWFAHKHYAQGETSYTMANLTVLLMSEIALQNVAAMVAFIVLMWRIWPRVRGRLADFARSRHIGGILLDVSGPLVAFVLSLICAFASAQIGA